MTQNSQPEAQPYDLLADEDEENDENEVPGVTASKAVSTEHITPELLLGGRSQPPSGGWRRIVYHVTKGLVNPGDSAAELRRKSMIARVRTPVTGGHHRVTVLSLKGGVGKTTTAIGLGSVLSSIRGDRVIAVDANPDHGTLSDRMRQETASTVRDLLSDAVATTSPRYADVRAYTSQSLTSRLEVLASARDPALSDSFSGGDYRNAAQLLEKFYSICITDCGTGLLHSAMAAILQLADQIVLVTIPSVASARSAGATLDWLVAHGHARLARSATVVLSNVRAKPIVDVEALRGHFSERCRAVVSIPFDPHLEEDSEIDINRLARGTQEAYLRLAATIGDGFT